MKSQRLLLSWILALGILGCDGKDGLGNITVQKGKGGGSAQDKLQDQIKQKALNDHVLVTVESESILREVNDKSLVFRAVIKRNNVSLGPWSPVLTMAVGDSFQTNSKDTKFDLLDDHYAMTLRAVRVQKNKKKYAGIEYILERTEEDSTKKTSHYLVLVDLSKKNTTTAMMKREIGYPIADDFDLAKWVDQQLQSH